MYNAEKRVVVLESNATLLNELKGAIERQGNFIVAYTGDDGGKRSEANRKFKAGYSDCRYVFKGA